MNNVILIGFMGSGKSSVGRFMTQFDYKLIDTDDYIEKKYNRKISDIFEKDGEPVFRKMETQVLSELLEEKAQRVVLSVGGGLPMTEANRPLLKKFGRVIYLKAKPETLERRLAKDTSRPLLQGGNLHDKIVTLMGKREKVYEQLADVVIVTDHRSFEEIYRQIEEML